MITNWCFQTWKNLALSVASMAPSTKPCPARPEVSGPMDPYVQCAKSQNVCWQNTNSSWSKSQCSMFLGELAIFFLTPPGTYFFMNFPNLKPMVLGYPATPNRKAPNDQRPFPFMGNFIWYFGGFLFPIIGNVQKLLGLEISYSFHYEIYFLSCSFLIPCPSISLAYGNPIWHDFPIFLDSRWIFFSVLQSMAISGS